MSNVIEIYDETKGRVITSKEKAEELYKKFAIGGWGKENALSCVDEILNICKVEEPICILGFDIIYYSEFYREVRNELIKM